MLGHLPLPTDLGDPEVFSVFILDPFDALQLRVDQEWPALAGEEDGGILHGHAVGGEALVLPGSHVGIVCQHPQGVQAGGDRDGDLRMKENLHTQHRSMPSQLGRDAQWFPKMKSSLKEFFWMMCNYFWTQDF